MNKHTSYDERQLLKLLAGSDHAAFSELFDRWYDTVYSSALIFSKSEELARDITQEVFMQLWNERTKMEHIEYPRAYLITAARNMIYRKLSRARLEVAYQHYLSGRPVSGSIAGEERAESNQLLHLLEEGIRLLPPQQQRAFRLSREQGMTHEAIAAEMQVSRKSVKDYIVRAIAFLRKYLARYGYGWLAMVAKLACQLFFLTPALPVACFM